MTWSVVKGPRVAEQCDVNIPSLTWRNSTISDDFNLHWLMEKYQIYRNPFEEKSILYPTPVEKIRPIFLELHFELGGGVLRICTPTYMTILLTLVNTMRLRVQDSFIHRKTSHLKFNKVLSCCSADGNYEVRYKSNVLIYPNGGVMWVPPAIYQSSCRIDVTYFPFDQQKCVMKFGSWTFNGDQVSLKLYNDNDWVDLSDYWKSGTWDIVEVPAFLNVYNNSKYGKVTETDISFYITIRRKTLFYTVNLILPTVLISFLCILVFYLPAEAGEKVTLGISILLSLVVFLLLVSKILPPTSLVLPLIAKYLLFTFLMNTVSILVTVIIINWNFRGPRTHRMPNWIRVVFLQYLPTMLMMKRPKKTRLRWMMDLPGVYHQHYHPSHPPPRSKVELLDVHHPNCTVARALSGSISSESNTLVLSSEAFKATEAVEFIAEHLRSEDEYIQVGSPFFIFSHKPNIHSSPN
ncbi:UNVERIFIED_CONTAM: nAChRbeta1 [Trichonephila clavipes]